MPVERPDRRNDPELALNASLRLTGERTAANALADADAILAWLRAPTSLSLVRGRVWGPDGRSVPLNRGETMAVTLKSGQIATFDIESRDSRGFLTKSALDLTVSGDVVKAAIVDTPDPNSPNQLVVTSVAPGAGGVVVLSVPDNDTIADASEAFDVTAGDVASIALGAPVITDAP